MAATSFQEDISAVGGISAVDTILEVICRSTGMGFAAIARVTEDRWIACQVRDDSAFGLQPGGELKVETTICQEVRNTKQAVFIDNVAEDAAYCGHPTPAMYGFQSYVSVPIMLKNGTFFGTLCAIDPRPARVNTPETVGMFKLFADLIAFYLHAGDRVEVTAHPPSPSKRHSPSTR
jgi:GAF domain-containing protein